MINNVKRIFFILTIFMLTACFIYAQPAAQRLTLGGYFNTGLGVVFSDSNDVDTFFKAFGADSEQNGYRLRLNAAYTSESGNFGIRLRFQSQSNLNQSGYFSLPYVYGWMNFFNDAVYLAAGIVDDTSFQTTDWWIFDDTGEGLGVLLKITPLSGLNIGLGVYIISQQAAGANNILNHGGNLPNFANITPRIEDAKYVFSASYTIPDIFWLGATFRTKNKAGWNGTLDIDRWGYVYDGRQESSQLFAEFRYLGNENLTAIASASIDRLEEFNARGDIVLSQTLSYRFDMLTIGFNAAEFIYNREDLHGNKIAYNPGLIFNLWGSYAISNIVPRLDIVYFMGGRSRLGGSESYMWHRRGFINREIYDIGSDNNRYPSVLSVRPSVNFNLIGGASIEIGNMFNYDFGNFDSAYGNSGDLYKRYLISNVFYIDLRWSF